MKMNASIKLMFLIDVIICLFPYSFANIITQSPWMDNFINSTLEEQQSYPQYTRKEYYRFMTSNQQQESLTSLNNVGTSPVSRELQYYKKPLIPTSELRFNKFKYITDKDALFYADFKPLVSKDFPISGFVNATLRSATTCHSVITLDDYEVKYDVLSILDAVGGYPSMPDENVNNIFWKYLAHVIHVQNIRVKNVHRRVLPRADLWEDFDLEQVAEAVHGEYPGFHPSNLMYRMIQGDYGEVVLDNNIIFKRCNVQFLHTDFMLADVNTWALNFVGPHNFALKWYIGRPRPEEVVWAIKTNVISRGVPGYIKAAVDALPIRKAEDFTAYPEGCPYHPAFPGMHGANGGPSLWMAVVLNLNEDQLCQVRLTDYAVGYARTVAGVHYPDDNIIGLNVAQEILSRALPGYLSDKYGSDPGVVRRKIQKVRFDWRTFDPKDPCPWLSKYSWYRSKYIDTADEVQDNVVRYGYYSNYDHDGKLDDDEIRWN